MNKLKRKLVILKERTFKRKIVSFYGWIKGAELVELNSCKIEEDPVRPELTLDFRITHDRKIFGLKYNNEIEAIVCVVFCPEVPYTLREMDYMSRVKDGTIAVAYTVWSRKIGAGKEIIKKLGEWVRENNYERLITLSPLTPMATHFHIRNGAKQVYINDETQNFEYNIIK